MKKVFFSLFFSICVMFYGCGCEFCCEVDCGNGICDFTAGMEECVCNDGFEPDSSGKCTIESRIKFLQPNLAPAVYQGIDSCLSGTAANLTISTVTNSINSLELSGLALIPQPITVIIPSKNEFKLKSSLTLNNGIVLNTLKGTISQSQLTVTYKVTENNVTKECVFVGSK